MTQFFTLLFLTANPLLGLVAQNTINGNGIDAEITVSSEAAILPTLSSRVEPTLPIRNYGVSDFATSAKSALIYDLEAKKILFSKDIFARLPLASLTKLTAATVAIQKIPLEQEIIISKQAVDTPGTIGNLNVGEKISFKNLLYILLLESSNDAATAIKENYPGDLIGDMNKQAKDWGLKDTTFEDPHGLSQNNQTTAWEISAILTEVLKDPRILPFLETAEISFPSNDGVYSTHQLKNTNKLLKRDLGVFAGKTGYTEEAGECMVVAAKAFNGDILIVAVLNTPDRIAETEKLILWAQQAYIWR